MAEIKIRELSIGDWVCDKNGIIAQVRDIECWSDGYVVNVRLKGGTISSITEEGVCPIPLLPKILEKNGFVKSSEYRWSNPSIGCACLRLGTKYWDIRINGRNRAYLPTRISIDNILHTHQLQHALRLAGVGKEIEL